MLDFDFRIQGTQTVKSWFLDDEGTTRWIERLRSYSEIRMGEIGESRAGRTMYGLMVGGGPGYISITAGAHADEPAGPMTACLLAEWLAGPSDQATALREHLTFMICPQVNPDGAEANKQWFAPAPDFETYLRHVKREDPGDDIEFGYPHLRPENTAVSDFLEAGKPYLFHASLHSMAFAEGAWLLLEKGRAAKSALIRNAFNHIFWENGFKLHDINRRGEKGFTRISPGYCTTPTSAAMIDHFMKMDDETTAQKFHWSSMEFIQYGSPDAFIMVTELPVFSISGGYVEGRKTTSTPANAQAPKPGSTNYEKFRDALRDCMAAGNYAGAVKLSAEYELCPVPFSVQCKTQFELIKLMAAGYAVNISSE